jgi:two-component system, OmpR family, response regulator
MKVVAVFPEPSLRAAVARILAVNRVSFDEITSLGDCLSQVQLCRYDATLIDSKCFGFEDVLRAVRELRKDRAELSLFVWVNGLKPEERASLYAAGADNCVSESITAPELGFRLRTSIELRRAAARAKVPVLQTGELELDFFDRTATRAGERISLRPKEFLLLEFLMRNVDHPVTREEILEQVWHTRHVGLIPVVDIYIESLRQKVDGNFPEELIATVHQHKYVLRGPEEARSLQSRARKAQLRFDSYWPLKLSRN